MVILGRTISSKTRGLVEELTNTFGKPVAYECLSAESKARHYFGSLDFELPTHYIVALDDNLDDQPFEANLLHELRHAAQIELGYPSVKTKQTYLQLAERPFFSILGNLLRSIILDLDVHRWLDSNGYSSQYFVEHRLQKALNDKTVYRLHIPFNLASLVANLLYVYLFVDQRQRDELEMAYSDRTPQAVDMVKDIKARITSLGYSTPESVLRCLGVLMDSLDLWAQYSITFNTINLRTTKEFHSFVDKGKGE